MSKKTIITSSFEFMDPNQLAQILAQRGGYNPTDAINAARGPRAAELAREFGSGGQTSSAGVTGASGNVTDIARQMLSLQQEVAKPAIQTLESGRQTLKERYDTLLKSIKERGAREVGQADIISARELGRRGIPTESTFAGEFQQERRLPVQTAFGSLEAETGLQGEQAQQAIASAIAQLQAGGGQNAITQALSLYGQQQSSKQEAEKLALQNSIASKPDTEVVTVGGRKKLINKQTGEVISDLGVAETTTTPTPTSTSDLAAISAIFGVQPRAGEITNVGALLNPRQTQTNPLDLFWNK